MKQCIIIPDSFKGTMNSDEVCEIEKEVLTNALPQWRFVTLPIADGGEGTVSCFLHALEGEKVSVTVKDAFGKDIKSFYGRFGNFAVIEMAAASGMVTNKLRDPLRASTYGVGQLINHAVASGCSSILIGLGGSCTNDAGTGMAAAVGTVFYDEKGEAFVPSGGTLDRIRKIDNAAAEKRLKDVEISCMCDIDNPLYGAEGAAFVFAPQKGADEVQVSILDKNLRAFADTLYREMKLDVAELPGGGAAGGMGAGAVAFLGADLKRGIDYILDIMGFDAMLKESHLVITGEGRLDSQSLRGKVISGVAGRAAAAKVPTIAVVGCISQEMKKPENQEAVNTLGIKKIYATSDGKSSMEEVRRTCRRNLAKTMEEAAEDIKDHTYKKP